MEEQEKKLSWRRRFGTLGALIVVTAAFVLVVPAIQQQKRLAATDQPVASADRAPANAPAADPAATNRAAGADPMERFRTEREQVRAVEIAQLNALIADDKADQSLRDEARRSLLDLTTFMEQEVTLEGVLDARGFPGALATVHRDSVNVLVRGDAITRAQSAIILELTLRETGQQSGNIKIIPVAQ